MDFIDYSPPKKPDVIIFDWDNTLVDAWHLIYQAIALTFKKFGKEPWSYEETKIRVHRSLKDTLPELFPDNWQEVGEYYRKSYSELSHLIEPLPHAEKLLQLLQKLEIKSAIVSNKSSDLLANELKNTGWGKYFLSTIGSGDLEVDKPHPKTVDETLTRIGESKKNNVIWFIGDSISDMEVAYASQITPVFYGPESFDTDQYKNYYPKIHVAEYSSLITFLEGKHDQPHSI